MKLEDEEDWMRVSVAFHNATILVPCGDGSCTVAELIDKAITRYKKHVNKVGLSLEH